MTTECITSLSKISARVLALFSIFCAVSLSCPHGAHAQNQSRVCILKNGKTYVTSRACKRGESEFNVARLLGGTGASGGTGAIGEIGPMGPSGSIGASGGTGGTGAPGVTGVTGGTGGTGAVGGTGSTGGTGAPGSSGSAGGTGGTGATGSTGGTGAIGGTGGTGAVGNAGVTGGTGAIGGTGATGGTGPVGGTGPLGGTGASGGTGAVGPSGTAGIFSAYLNNLNAPVIAYIYPVGFQASYGSSPSSAGLRMPAACTARNISVQFSTSPGSGNSYTFALYVNGATSALSCTIANTNTSCDGSATVALAAGDTIMIEITKSNTPDSGAVSVTFNCY